MTDSSDIPDFVYEFSFPKLKKIKEASLKAFTNTTSFPLICTSIQIRNISKRSFTNGPELKIEGSRAKNRFIVARNLISTLIKEDVYRVSEISKLISMIWNLLDERVKIYFQYLSILGSAWKAQIKLEFEFGSIPQQSCIVPNFMDYERVYNSLRLSKNKPIPFKISKQRFKIHSIKTKEAKVKSSIFGPHGLLVQNVYFET